MLFATMHYIFMRKVCIEKLDGIKVFDMKFIIILSTIVLLLTFGTTILYNFSIIRYIIIIIGIIIIIVKRNYILTGIKKILTKK